MNCPRCDAPLETNPIEGEAFMLDGGTPKFKGTYSRCTKCEWSSVKFEPSLPFTPASLEIEDPDPYPHTYDAKGERRDFKDLPKSITELKDDPFRSLAGELRRSGGFAKDTTPFSEFLWADFLRRRISNKAVEDNFAKAMEKSLALAKGPDAVYLPGWCGPAPDG